MRAWLLTWEGTSADICAENKIIAIISSRRSIGFIRDVVDLLYSHADVSAYGAVLNANRRMERRDGLTMSGGVGERFFFGENPCIFARRVSEVRVNRRQSEGVEVVTWIDPPYLKVERSGELPIVADPPRRCRLVRPVNASLGGCLWSSGHGRGGASNESDWYTSEPVAGE
jgi:hypothetical protein